MEIYFFSHPLSYYLPCLHLCQLMFSISHNVIAIKPREHTHTVIVKFLQSRKTQHVLWLCCLLDYWGCHQCRNLYLCLVCDGFLPVKLMNGCCKMLCKKKSFYFLLRDWHQRLAVTDVLDCWNVFCNHAPLLLLCLSERWHCLPLDSYHHRKYSTKR